LTKRDELRGPLGCHDTRKPGNRQHIAFLDPALLDESQGGRQHNDITPGNRDPRSVRLGADIDHACLSIGVEMG
jgi:hypothetical protein